MKKGVIWNISASLLLLLLYASYSGHFHNPFQFDDEHTIVTNKYIRDLKNIPLFFKDATTTSSLPANQAYRPGLTTLNAIDYWIANGANPLQFHISVFCSYILLLIMLFFLFRKIFNLVQERLSNKWIALFAAAFYGLHPSNAETINYIIARSDSFSTLMVIIGINIYLYYPKKRQYQLYLLPMIIGFFVKEPAIMLVPLIFVYELIFNKTDYTGTKYKKAWKNFSKALLAVLPGMAIALGLFILSRQMTPDTWTPTNISRMDYLITQPFVIVHYFNNFILPVNLVADTDWKAITNYYDDRVFIGIIFIGTMLFLAFLGLKKKTWRPFSYGIFWFLITLLPTSSIFPLGEVLNDHRTFFPYIGLAMSLGCLGAHFYSWIKKKHLVSVFISSLCLIFVLQAYGTRKRCHIWSSGELLWHDVAVKSPGNARGLMNYGNALMSKGKYEESLKYFKTALKLWPYYSYIHINMGVLLGAMKRNDEAEYYFKNGIQYGFMNPEAYYFYAKWLSEQGRMEEAKSLLNKCLEISPGHILASSLLNTLDSMKSYRADNGVELALEKVHTDPSPETYLNLSLAYYNNGKFKECITAAKKSLELKPDYALAYNNICSAYNELQQWDLAIEACNQALKIKPDYDLATNNLNIAVAAKNAEQEMKGQ